MASTSPAAAASFDRIEETDGDIKRGMLKWAWIPGIPLLWDLVVTMTASWQKIFSSDPNLGYWTLHAMYKGARDQGLTSFKTAKNIHELDAIIRNTFIQGTLSIVFAVLVLMVVIAVVAVALRAIRGGARPVTADDPVPSRIFAPSGMIPTKAEREVQKQWDASPGGFATSAGTGSH